MSKEKVKKVVSVVTVPLTLAVSSGAFAETANTADAVVAALTVTASEITSTLAKIAPVALTISGTFLVWRYGMRFFKSLSR